MRRYRKLGFAGWSREQWLFVLPTAWGRAFGFFWNTVSRELVFILGCRMVERSQLGVPRTFVGGLHFTLSADAPFVLPMTPMLFRPGAISSPRRRGADQSRPGEAR